jgi:hypothetical protein
VPCSTSLEVSLAACAPRGRPELGQRF